jgi:hypothetical protein
MMMMTMMTISSTTNHLSTISTLPADESDDSLSDSSYHNNYKRDNLSSDLLCQDEEMNSTSEREGGSDKETDSASEREGGSEEETVPDEYGEGVEDMMNMERELRTSGRR